MHDDGQPRVEAQKDERRRRGCRTWFWAWGPEGTRCYFCQPLPRAELTRFRAAMESGNGHDHGTGHLGGPGLVLMHRTRPAGATGAGGVSGGGTTRVLQPVDLCGAPAGR
jgi:hypothetical protein